MFGKLIHIPRLFPIPLLICILGQKQKKSVHYNVPAAIQDNNKAKFPSKQYDEKCALLSESEKMRPLIIRGRSSLASLWSQT